MAGTTTQSNLAIDGGPKAMPARSGKPQPKIGVEEFMSIAERFGFTAEALDRLRKTVTNADLQGNGPNLAKYACPFPKPTKGGQYEALAREFFGVKHALGVSSGTGALHSAMVAVGAGPGKEVIVPATGFLATGAAVALAGGTPVFCDIDDSLQIDPTKIEALITERTVAIAPTHHWGTVCDMDPIMAIAKKHGLKVVEDCAQSPGARYRGRRVGSIGDIGCFSISAYKIIGGGEGGLVITSDDRLFDRVNQLAECGGLWRTDRFAPPRYEGELFVGTNYRLSELEAAVDLIQLGKLKDVVGRYRHNSLRILRQLTPCREITPQAINDLEGEIGYSIRFFPESAELAVRIAEALRAEGVGAGTRAGKPKPDWHIYCDMYPLQAAAGGANMVPGKCPVADELFLRTVAIGVDQWLDDTDCDAIAAAINKVLAAYCTPDDNAGKWC